MNGEYGAEMKHGQKRKCGQIDEFEVVHIGHGNTCFRSSVLLWVFSGIHRGKDGEQDIDIDWGRLPKSDHPLCGIGVRVR